GQTYGAVTLDSNEVRYAGGTSTQCQKESPFGSSNCNGLFSDSAVLAMQNGLREALAKIDGSVDWTQYDSDGDNVVDLILRTAYARRWRRSMARWTGLSTTATATTS